MRGAGVLLPIFSLPGKYGIGRLGREAFWFADKLKEAGQSYWQILPTGPTGYGDSPYQPFSTFAGNPYFIDPEGFPDYVLKETRLKEEEKAFLEDLRYVNYEKLYDRNRKLLFEAYQVENYCGIEKNYPDFQEFCEKNKSWLYDYAMYMSLKEELGGLPWYEWPDELKLRDRGALERASLRLGDSLRFYHWQQYHFMRQWRKLKEHANENGILIIGDIPVYVSADSADAWANPKLYQFDPKGRPVSVAGVPPDAFSESGQLWGNPVYDWNYHRQTDYKWWTERMQRAFDMYDVLRIDHFRGFDEYYCIPFGDKDAKGGHWEKGPGLAFFKRIEEKLGEKAIIAEDLGLLTDSVRKLVKDTGFPGMKVLEFAFSSKERSDYLPYKWEKNCIAYTGTHDNETLYTWFDELSKEDLEFVSDYLDLKNRDREEYNEAVIRLLLGSVADTVIVPMQDWIGLDYRSRINTPSTLGLNWKWRLEKKQADEELIKRMKKLTELYER